MHKPLLRRCRALLLPLAILPLAGLAQAGLSPKEIKKLSVDELLNMEVTLVSRTPQRLTEAASAIQVITSEDIRRSAATNIPEALRLATNLQVSQLSASVWIISARGFNNIFSNKLLVMIDGRTVYTPLYAGVLWEQQNVVLEDVERIEVVSGPGGTLWGPNAVNGVINIVTKSATQTEGLYASVLAGSWIKDNVALRYGSKIGRKGSFRVFGQHFDRRATELANGNRNADAWRISQAGFRSDWNLTPADALTVQGDYYWGTRKTKPGHSDLNGQNILARWRRAFSDSSDLTLQVYFDRYYREDAGTASYDEINTIDLDVQHRLPIGKRQSFVYGAGYRYVKDDARFSNTAGAGIVPRFKRLDLATVFAQDEWRIAERLRLTAGVRLLHNVYTGFEWQPNARISWLTKKSTLWGAVSRAVRTPSRLDRDYFLPMTPQPPNVPSVAGGPDFVSEKLVAYELGYRFQPNALSSFSISTFFNNYTDVYSVTALPGTLTYVINNQSEAKAWGAELAGNYELTKNWRLRGGYTFFKKELRAKEGVNFNPAYLGNDVRNQAMIQSILDLPLHLQLDVVARHLDGLSASFATARVPAYRTFDARLAYSGKGWELALAGQNLAENKHTEFGTFELPRHFYAKLTARF